MANKEIVELLEQTQFYANLLKETYNYRGMGGLYELCNDLDKLPQHVNVLYQDQQSGDSLVMLKLKSYEDKSVLIRVNVANKTISKLESTLQVQEGFLLK